MLQSRDGPATRAGVSGWWTGAKKLQVELSRVMIATTTETVSLRGKTSRSVLLRGSSDAKISVELSDSNDSDVTADGNRDLQSFQ
jgi:hypothetical protein